MAIEAGRRRHDTQQVNIDVLAGGSRYEFFYRFIMAALRSRCGHYIFALWFLLSSFFYFLA